MLNIVTKLSNNQIELPVKKAIIEILVDQILLDDKQPLTDLYGIDPMFDYIPINKLKNFSHTPSNEIIYLN